MKETGYAILLTCVFLITSLSSTGQDTIPRTRPDSGSIRIVKDARIDQLIAKQIEVNEYTTRSGRRVTAGFRLLVSNTKDRQEAIQAKTLIYQNYPDLKPYLWHQAPYYKLKVGNFKTKEDALYFSQKLKPLFPKGVFVMNDEIDTYFINNVPQPNNR
ncbi:MAG: SPOR domain-containing protein [Bacteroidota bacterium]|jgi:hypothetical protein